MAEADAVDTQAAETAAQAHSNNADATAGTVDKSSEVAAQLESERKARQQAEMRANQLENEKREREQKDLEDQGKWKELAEKRDAELAALRQKQELDDLLDGQPEAVRKSFKKIMAADTALDQVAALQEAITGQSAAEDKPADKQPPVQPLNPNPSTVQSAIKDDMTLDQMEEALQKATQGKGL